MYKTLEKLFKDAKMDKNEVDDILLLGGFTQIPKIQNMLKVFFNGKEPTKIENPEEIVVYGIAIQAAIITNIKSEKIEKFVLMDVTCIYLGIETEGGIMLFMIPKNSLFQQKKLIYFH